MQARSPSPAAACEQVGGHRMRSSQHCHSSLPSHLPLPGGQTFLRRCQRSHRQVASAPSESAIAAPKTAPTRAHVTLAVGSGRRCRMPTNDHSLPSLLPGRHGCERETKRVTPPELPRGCAHDDVDNNEIAVEPHLARTNPLSDYHSFRRGRRPRPSPQRHAQTRGSVLLKGPHVNTIIPG